MPKLRVIDSKCKKNAADIIIAMVINGLLRKGANVKFCKSIRLIVAHHTAEYRLQLVVLIDNVNSLFLELHLTSFSNL